MKEIIPVLKKYWSLWWEKSGNVSRWLMIPTVCYLELLFRFWTGGSFAPGFFIELIGFAVCIGGILNLIAAVLPKKYVRWYVGVAIFLCTTVMMVEFLIGDAYYNYMRPTLIFVSAGGVLSDYSDTLFLMIFSNLGRIAISLLPLWVLLASGKEKEFRYKPCAIICLACSLVGAGLGFIGLSSINDGLSNVVAQYDFNSSMKRNGITVSMYMELSGLGNQGAGLAFDDADFDFEPVEIPTTEAATEPAETTAPTVPETTETVPAETEASETQPVPETTAAQEPEVAAAAVTPSTEPETEPVTEATTVPETEPVTEATTVPETEPATEATTVPKTEPVTEATTVPETEPATEATTIPETEPETQPAEERVYKPHVIDGLDFGKLAETDTDSVRRKLFAYIDSQTPAMENEYTGLFEGKNLILITAEAFNYALIDPVRTPTLYRLATQGIEFTNYYQPLWTGNTSGGELVNLSGLAMTCEMVTYTNQKPFNTMGWQLMNQGYFSRAYHDNGYYYYDRDKTHANLGYEKYIGIGNGMEEGVQDLWPQSDEEMFQFTVPQYIDQQPFSIYYMTVSAHCRYNKGGNAMSRKNYDLVADLPYSEALKCYLAANMEVEKGLTFLVEQLEKAGIADDTVIVLAPDHFPYGLGTAWGNDHDCLGELYGETKYDIFQRDKNTLIIWSGCLEGKDIKVTTPVCSVDILPTLSNLFGLEYDSRLSVGRDVLGDEEGIAFWPDYNWITEYGKYNSTLSKFIPFTDEELPEGYVDRINAIVRNRVSFSRTIQTCKFFTAIQEAMGR